VGSGGEEEVTTEVPSKALPALSLLKDLLNHKYVFHEGNRLNSWNVNELEQSAKKTVCVTVGGYSVPYSARCLGTHLWIQVSGERSKESREEV
jgi:hypothetical protein